MERTSYTVTREEEGRGRGRPTLYNPNTMPERAYKLCMLGLTEEQLAIAFGVHVNTIRLWKNKYPDFEDAVMRGKEMADFEVANALYHRAKGYEQKEKFVRIVNGQAVEFERVRYVPPDTTACIFWLKNRQRQNWRDVWAMEHTGPGGGPIQVDLPTALAKINLEEFSEAELEMVAAIGIKIKRGTKELTNAAEDEIVDID